MKERFLQEGVNYYQQGRKCGKPTCKCAQGELHGPYWYARDVYNGQVRYLGRELPAEVLSAREAFDRLLPEMTKRRRELLRQYDALGRLLKCERLTDEDRVILEMFGFGEALVSNGGQAATQEES
jgi:hypothetical protein